MLGFALRRAARPASRAAAGLTRPSNAAFTRFMSDKAEADADLGTEELYLDLDKLDFDMDLEAALHEDGIGSEHNKKGPQKFKQPGVEENPKLAIYDDVLDIRNPPRLRAEHYELLRSKHIAIDFTGRHDPVREKHEDNINSLAEQIQLLSDKLEEEFGIVPDHTPVTNTSGLPQDPRYLAIDADPRQLGELEHEIKELETPLMKRGECVFCQPDPTGYYRLEYTNIRMLRAFINRRGMIVNRRYSNNCALHQRKVARCIKRARVMGLMSFVSDWDVPVEFVQAEAPGPDGQPGGAAPRTRLGLLGSHRLPESEILSPEENEVDLDSTDDGELDVNMIEEMAAKEEAYEQARAAEQREKEHDELRDLRKLAEAGKKEWKPSHRHTKNHISTDPDHGFPSEDDIEEQILEKRARKAAKAERLAREAREAEEAKKDE